MLDGNTLAEVSVDVYANTDRLEEDFRAVRQETAQLDRDLQKIRQDFVGFNAATAGTGREIDRLMARYDPLHRAHSQFAKDLDIIERAQREGFITLDQATDLHKKATEAVNSHGRAQSQMAVYAEKAGEQLKRWGTVALAAAGVAAIALVRSSLQSAKALEDQSKQLAISVEDLQRWNFIAERSGASAGTFAQGYEQLQNTMGRAAAGSSRQAKLFDALGVSLKDANGQSKSAIQILPELADALENVTDKNQRAAAAQILFGEAGNEMLAVLAGGSARIDELSDSAERLGIVLSDDEIRNLADTNQKLEDLKNVLSAQISGVVADNANAILGLASALGSLTSAVLDFLNSNPTAAMAIIGGLAGMRFGGPIGGIIGAAGGAAVGVKMGESRDAANMDLEFRRERLAHARELYERQRAASPAPGFSAQSRRRYEQEMQRYDAALSASLGGMSGVRDALGDRAAGPGGIDLSGLLTPQRRTRGGGGRDTSEADRLRALRADKAFEDELASLRTAVLRAAASQAGNAEDRAQIELQILDIEKDRFERTLELEGPAGTKKYSQVEAEMLRTRFLEVDAAKRALVDLERQDRIRKDELALGRSRLDADTDILEYERSMARTNKRRKELDLELLDLKYQMQVAALDAVIASHESSDIEKQIAEERKQHLEIMREFDVRALEERYIGPVEAFFESLELTGEQVEEALERIRAARLEDQRARAVQFADDIGEAFANMGRAILDLQNPFDILKALIADLASIFTEEVLIRPLQDAARERIGGPLAERVVGMPAGPENLWMRQLGTEAFEAATALDKAAAAATRFSQGVVPSVKVLDGAAQDSAQSMSKQATAADQAATGLLQLFSTVSGGGGGSSTALGFLQFGLSILGGSIGGGAGPNAALVPDVMANIAANPGIFHEGGTVGPDGRPIRRRLRPGEVNITARVGETVIPEGPSRDFAPILDSIRLGRLPRVGALGGLAGQRVDARSFPVQFGDIRVEGVDDERKARRSAKQIMAEINRGLGRAAQHGIKRND